jgi:hypothetical protein
VPGRGEECGTLTARPRDALANAELESICTEQFEESREGSSQESNDESVLTGAGASMANSEDADGWKGVEGVEERAGIGRSGFADECAELPLFAPRPGDFGAWREALEIDATVKPAICRVRAGLAKGMDGDRLRLTGNGVVPLAAAYAFVSLAAALASGDMDWR